MLQRFLTLCPKYDELEIITFCWIQCDCSTVDNTGKGQTQNVVID